jgi:hypothetical protein
MQILNGPDAQRRELQTEERPNLLGVEREFRLPGAISESWFDHCFSAGDKPLSGTMSSLPNLTL